MKVAVIGAGYAGLAAAVELAARGVAVSVFESARELGGRARRVGYRGLTLDNGQHIFLGAYRETLRLMRLAGANPDELLLRLPLQLDIPGHFRLRAAALPAPLHLAVGLATARGLSWAERLAALRFMETMRRQNFRLPQDISATTLLQQHGQVGRLRCFLWEPLCVAALNTPLDLSSAQVFLNVLRDSLAGSRQDCDMLLPLTDLSRLFPDHAAAFIERNGGQVLRSQTVLAVRREGNGFELQTRQGSERFDQIVSAVPPQRLAALTSQLPELATAVKQVGCLSYQPIYTAFLQYPAGTCLPEPILGMNGGITQWVFDHGQLRNEPGLLCAVISAAGPHQALSHDELAQQVDSELRTAFPSLPPLQWHKVIAEKRATFSCTPGLERPAQATPLPNFFLAGDYTAGDYPATLEGAVRSGVKCAQLIQDRP